MNAEDDSGDIRAIEAVIARQFGAMNWSPEAPPDWAAFAVDFFPGAALFPAARPATPQTVEAFVERMGELAGSRLRSFAQRVLGTEIQVFGNVAVAMGACENVENETEVVRGVEAFLLVKDDGVWRIASQAWDTESASNPVPDRLLAGGTSSRVRR